MNGNPFERFFDGLEMLIWRAVQAAAVLFIIVALGGC